MRVIIPAAGRGTRLRPQTDLTPKALVRVAGKPLLWHGLERLADVGFTEAVIVCGYRGDQLRESLVKCHPRPDLRFVMNQEYASTNSIVSVALTRQWWNEPFCIIDGDVLTARALLKRLLGASNDVLAVDKTKPYDQIDMKVEVRDGLVREFGKDLPRSRCAGEFFGVSRWTPAGAAALSASIDAMLRRGRRDEWYEMAIRDMASEHPVRILDSASDEWAEVDSATDLIAAAAMAERE